MAGIGVYRWVDGRTYNGEFQSDRKHGYGVYTWPDGRQYSGYWVEGKQHGLGIYQVPAEKKIKHGLWEGG